MPPFAALGYLAEDAAVSGRELLGRQSEPGAEVAAFGERIGRVPLPSDSRRLVECRIEEVGPGMVHLCRGSDDG